MPFYALLDSNVALTVLRVFTKYCWLRSDSNNKHFVYATVSSLQVSHCSINLAKLNNFCDICFHKILLSKKLFEKSCRKIRFKFDNKFWDHGAFRSTSLIKQTCTPHIHCRQSLKNVSLLSLIVSEELSGNRDPLKKIKYRPFLGPEVT